MVMISWCRSCRTTTSSTEMKAPQRCGRSATSYVGRCKRYCNSVLDCREDGLYFCFTSPKIVSTMLIALRRGPLSPEIPKTCWRQFRVAHRVLDIPVPKVSLQGSSIMPFVGQCVAAGMAQHVRVGLEAQPCLSPSSPDHAGETCGAKRRPALRREHEG